MQRIKLVLKKMKIASLIDIFQTLSFLLIIFIIEKVKFHKSLDYKNANIQMNIKSTNQLYRTKSCKKEPETVKWIEEYIKPNHVLYDIGANVGVYSFVCYEHNKGQCQIYSFEPSFSTYSALCENILINNYNDKIIAFPYIITDHTKIGKFFYSSLSPGDASHSVNKEIKRPTKQKLQKSFEDNSQFYSFIASYRLDDLIEIFNLQKPNHIKIDVDGHELAVIRGCGSILKSPELKSILVEIDKSDPDHLNLINLLQSNDFIIKNIYPHGDGTISNYIFVR